MDVFCCPPTEADLRCGTFDSGRLSKLDSGFPDRVLRLITLTAS